MAQMGRPGLPPEGKSEVWRRWRAGESFLGIGKALGKPAGSIYGVIRLCGGYTPAARKRSPRALTLSEREDISRAASRLDFQFEQLRASWAARLPQFPVRLRVTAERVTIELWKRMSEPRRLLSVPNAASWSKIGACAMRSNVSFAANGLQSK
jgi:hypothetical protein